VLYSVVCRCFVLDQTLPNFLHRRLRFSVVNGSGQANTPETNTAEQKRQKKVREGGKERKRAVGQREKIKKRVKPKQIKALARVLLISALLSMDTCLSLPLFTLSGCIVIPLRCLLRPPLNMSKPSQTMLHKFLQK
jgi:hypothetical protein